MKTTFLRGSITHTQFSLLLSDDEDEDVSRSPLARSLLMKTPRLTTPKFPWAKKSRPFARAELHYEASLCWKNKIFHLGRAIIHCIGCLYTLCCVLRGDEDIAHRQLLREAAAAAVGRTTIIGQTGNCCCASLSLLLLIGSSHHLHSMACSDNNNNSIWLSNGELARSFVRPPASPLTSLLLLNLLEVLL